MTSEQLDKLNKWAAEKSGVVLYRPKEINEHGHYWYLLNEPDIEHDDEWTLTDPRCREIVREKLLIETWFGSEGWWGSPVNIEIPIGHNYETIADAELACILAIMVSEVK